MNDNEQIDQTVAAIKVILSKLLPPDEPRIHLETILLAAISYAIHTL